MSPIFVRQSPADFYTRSKINVKCDLMQSGISHKSMILFTLYSIQAKATGLKLILDTVIKSKRFFRSQRMEKKLHNMRVGVHAGKSRNIFFFPIAEN